MSDQRRQAPRFSAEVLLWWIQDWEPIPVSLVDISRGGMSCEFPQEVRPHQTLELQFEFPRHQERIDSTCEVIHVQERGSRRFQVGLKIVELKGISHRDFSKKMMMLPGLGEDQLVPDGPVDGPVD